LSFGGSDAPAANVRLMSIGNITGDKTAPLVAQLTDFISTELGIPKNRYLSFLVRIRKAQLSDTTLFSTMPIQRQSLSMGKLSHNLCIGAQFR
jgi:hypothetical protein